MVVCTLSLNLEIGPPRNGSQPIFRSITTTLFMRSITTWMRDLYGETCWNYVFEVNIKKRSRNCWYNVCLNRPSGWGWATFEINEARHIPLLSNTAQSKSLNRLPSFYVKTLLVMCLCAPRTPILRLGPTDN